VLEDLLAVEIVHPGANGSLGSSGSQNQRRAKLFLQKQDHNKLLGKDNTNGKLRWTIELKPTKPGAYFAKVIDQVRGGNDCQSDKTRTIVIN